MDLLWILLALALAGGEDMFLLRNSWGGDAKTRYNLEVNVGTMSVWKISVEEFSRPCWI